MSDYTCNCGKTFCVKITILFLQCSFSLGIELTLSMVIVKESESGGIGGGLLSPPRRLSEVAPLN